MKLHFPLIEPPPQIEPRNWADWRWQLKNSLKSYADFATHFELCPSEEEGFGGLNQLFKVRVSPYYAALADRKNAEDPIRKIIMPRAQELIEQGQQMLDPLGERGNNPAPRVIHRYPDRCLLLVTDFCSVYCRYCTRKHFTGQDQALIPKQELEEALKYIKASPTIREVILSGGDPLTLGDGALERVLKALRDIEHVEIIRIGTRVPVVLPQRINLELVQMLKKYQPLFIMGHFNHPRELTQQAAEALGLLVDHGLPVMNQMVLLNGVNNHPAHVKALSRRLLFLRVKPYYMFQCDPSQATDHLRTTIENSEWIQRELWGQLSGLALPNLSLDIPGGGGKVGLVPTYECSRSVRERHYRGWDGVSGVYQNPDPKTMVHPADLASYLNE